MGRKYGRGKEKEEFLVIFYERLGKRREGRGKEKEKNKGRDFW